MRKRTIPMSLSVTSIENAVKEVQVYKDWIVSKTYELVKALSDEGVEIATVKFKNVEYDGENDVSVSIEERGENKTAIVAVGNSVLFIEFGTGVRYSTPVHPEASVHDMMRGEYGYKLGRLAKGWRYRGVPGTNGEVISEGKHAGEIHTYGNPANMSMYMTVRELEDKFEEIARRVFT